MATTQIELVQGMVVKRVPAKRFCFVRLDNGLDVFLHADEFRTPLATGIPNMEQRVQGVLSNRGADVGRKPRLVLAEVIG